MMTPACPACRAPIPEDDINVATDVAMCRACNKVHSLAHLRDRVALGDVSLSAPPQGVHVEDDGSRTVVRTSLRSLPNAAAALAFAVFWNGIVSVFVLVNLAATLKHLGVSLPAWFPAPEVANGSMGLGMSLFLWVFLTPFILVGAAVLAAVALSLAGRCDITLAGDRGEVFTGVGPLGFRKSFTPAEVRRVSVHDRTWRDSDGDARSKREIVLHTDHGETRFGSMIPQDRMKYTAAALIKVLAL